MRVAPLEIRCTSRRSGHRNASVSVSASRIGSYLQVILLACAPCLFNEDHMMGRCLSRLRFVYNEYC